MVAIGIKTFLGLIVLNHFIFFMCVFVILCCYFASFLCITYVAPLCCSFALLILLLICHVLNVDVGLSHC